LSQPRRGERKAAMRNSRRTILSRIRSCAPPGLNDPQPLHPRLAPWAVFFRSFGAEPEPTYNQGLRLKTIHLERPFSPLRTPHRPAAGISAARNLNNLRCLSMYIFICTYILVHNNVPVGTYRQIAFMFLQEHSRGPDTPGLPRRVKDPSPHDPCPCDARI
jgi:hypothetical protein